MLRASMATALLLSVVMGVADSALGEQRDAVSYLRGRYNFAFYARHPLDYRMTTVAHWGHAEIADRLLLEPLGRASETDRDYFLAALYYFDHPPKTEPHQEFAGPYTARVAWKLFNVINWTHQLHEQLYDVMAYKGIPLDRKKAWMDRAVDYYLAQRDIAFSPAPFEEVIMKRVRLMKQPWFKRFRENYPRSNSLFWAFHWWHPVVYEAQLRDYDDQDAKILEIDRVFLENVLPHPPNRMVLSREAMPQFSRLMPRAANIFDNLHMLHGISYDIFASDDMTIGQKRAQLYRVISLMLVRPGDEELADRFEVDEEYLEADPTEYDLELWTQDPGAMGELMMPGMTEEEARRMMPVVDNTDLMQAYRSGDARSRRLLYK